MDSLNRFLQDIDCLEPITKAVNKVNIFEVLSISRTEIRHSNMLAWLMNPNANHGLGDRVLRGIFGLATEKTPSSYHDFSIRRESNHIDLLAISESERFVLCIENKTYSDEHDDQLSRYKQYVDSSFPGYRQVLIYLTRRGKASSDPENWVSMGYGDILKVIDEARKGVTLEPEVELILNNYVEVIQGLSGGDNALRRSCEEVYKKHQKALDALLKFNTDEEVADSEETKAYREICWKYRKELQAINKYKPGKESDPIAAIIHTWAEMNEKIDICPEKTTDAYTRFTTKTMSKLLPDATGNRSGWNTENFYFYELRNATLKTGEHEVYLQLCINLRNIPDDLKKMSDRINQIKSPVVESKEHRCNFVTDHVFFKANAEEETVITQLDKFLDEMTAFERELVEGLGL